MKKSLIALVVIGVATAGVFYVNKQAEDAIKQQLENANQSYRDLAVDGEMPVISLSYQDVSANILTSSYSISGLAVNVGEMGTVATVDFVQAKGMKPQSLSDSGSMTVTGIKAAPAILTMLPPQTSAFLQGLALHGDYDYAYNDSGELVFNQQTRINDEFAFNYSFSLSQMQQFWQFAKEMSALPPEQQQALAQRVDDGVVVEDHDVIRGFLSFHDSAGSPIADPTGRLARPPDTRCACVRSAG